jgi:hypothetical protein
MSEGKPTFRVDARHWWRWGHAILKGWERAGGCPAERRYPGAEDDERATVRGHTSEGEARDGSP